MLTSTVAIALRELRRNAVRSMLTALGVIIGVASVISMVTLGEGATAAVTDEISALGRNMLILVPGQRHEGPPTGSSEPFSAADVRALRAQVPSLEVVAPTASRQALVRAGSETHGTTVLGTERAWFRSRDWGVSIGRIFTEGEEKAGAAVCVLGETVRDELFGALPPLERTLRVGTVPCRVIGVLDAKGRSTFGADQDELVVLPLSAFHRRVAGNTDVSSMILNARADEDTTRVAEQVDALMRERRGTRPGEEPDFRVQDLKEVSRLLRSATGVLTALLGAIAAVSLLVGGFGIMNIMLVSVTERTREIGIRLAIGARARDVQRQFLVEAMVLSLAGGLVGVGVGLAGSWLAAAQLGIPFVPTGRIVALAFGFSATIGVVFGYFPARKASRLDPIDALRHD